MNQHEAQALKALWPRIVGPSSSSSASAWRPHLLEDPPKSVPEKMKSGWLFRIFVCQLEIFSSFTSCDVWERCSLPLVLIGLNLPARSSEHHLPQKQRIQLILCSTHKHSRVCSKRKSTLSKRIRFLSFSWTVMHTFKAKPTKRIRLKPQASKSSIHAAPTCRDRGLPDCEAPAQDTSCIIFTGTGSFWTLYQKENGPRQTDPSASVTTSRIRYVNLSKHSHGNAHLLCSLFARLGSSIERQFLLFSHPNVHILGEDTQVQITGRESKEIVKTQRQLRSVAHSCRLLVHQGLPPYTYFAGEDKAESKHLLRFNVKQCCFLDSLYN